MYHACYCKGKQEKKLMKRIIHILLCAVLSMFLCIEKVHAADTLRNVRVNASFLNDTVEVTRKILEIDGRNGI